ncbi:MAG: 3-deoxy-8-phosphooctulonate synthase [Flavobacteriaceae bacterium]|nr:3-deoxy-8-phosphooctulonate synthase [Flavobacteriaceae bacterium]
MDFNRILNKNSKTFFLIAGPCAIEDELTAFEIALHIQNVCQSLNIPFIFKGSFKKANRTRIDSFTGIGNEKALKILKKISQSLNIPTLTDIHESSDAEMAAEYVDILQIPAFLIRQTDLIKAASNTGKTVNLKKGQFMSPQSMKFAVEKVKDSGNKNVIITERGTQFGYNDLVVDFRGIPHLRTFAPTVMDITHSLQQPNTSQGITGGLPHLIETMGRAAIAVGVDGIFLETHPEPSTAKSDGKNMLQLNLIENLLSRFVDIQNTINKF